MTFKDDVIAFDELKTLNIDDVQRHFHMLASQIGSNRRMIYKLEQEIKTLKHYIEAKKEIFS